MCDRRLQQPTVTPFGGRLLQLRRRPDQLTQPRRSARPSGNRLQMSPGADHIHYALALAQALAAISTDAHDNLGALLSWNRATA